MNTSDVEIGIPFYGGLTELAKHIKQLENGKIGPFWNQRTLLIDQIIIQ